LKKNSEESQALEINFEREDSHDLMKEIIKKSQSKQIILKAIMHLNDYIVEKWDAMFTNQQNDLKNL
jgi:hypothetical protein